MEQLKVPGTKASAFEWQKKALLALPEFARITPCAIKQGAVADACLAVKAAKAKFRVEGKENSVAFRSRRDPRQTLFIRNDTIRSGTIYPARMGKLQMAEDLPESPRDSQLLYEHGRYYLCVPYKTTIHRGENQARIVGLDPGVRTFMSFYSPEGAGKLGEYDFGRIARLCQHLDNLISRMAANRKDGKVTAIRRQRMKKAAGRLRWKIRDLITEAHWKIADFLVRNYSVIFLPELETAKLSVKQNRKLASKSVKAMLTWSHYKFKLRLEHAANKAGAIVTPVCEAYTSKTVNWTGYVNHKLGGAKFVRDGGQKMDRDLNGALGVFLKGIAGYGLDGLPSCIC